MPSHRDEHCLPQGVSEFDRKGNMHADTLAGEAAAVIKLPNAVAVPHIHYYKLVKRIQLRLACILVTP